MGEIDTKYLCAFNSPYELGVRMVYLLNSMFPASADIEKLLLLDYAVIHSKDFDGPDSLHTPVPYRTSEIYVRYDAAKLGMYVMCTKRLVDMQLDKSGITYLAGENSRVLIDSIDSLYLSKLIDRCDWVVNKFGGIDTFELSRFFNDHGHRWSTEPEIGKS